MIKCKFHILEDRKGCKFCSKWRQTFRQFKRTKCSSLKLYCVKLTHYRTGEQFYKIGLTSQTIERRFNETMERFYLEVEWEVTLSLYDAVCQETNLLYHYQVIKGRKYIPKAKIVGYTECITI